MRAREGFFQAAYALKKHPQTDKFTHDHISSLIEWIEYNLDAPPRFNRTKSRNHSRLHTAGLSWFKSSATEHLEKAHELATLLVQHGYGIEVLKTLRPGYIIYEDEVQIVAEPFADTPV